MDTSDISDVTGFILREFKYKESSKILEVFTEKFGRISIIAKGAMSKHSRILGATQRFVKANYSLYKSGKEFYGIREATVLNSYFKSNKNFDIILYKSVICDLLLRTIDQIQYDVIYKLLDNTFDAFEKASANHINIFLAFLLKYISFSGFKPNLSSCGVCGRQLKDDEIFFSIIESSIICEEDRLRVRDKVYLTDDEFNYLKSLLYTKSEELAQIEKPKDYKKIAKLIIDYTLNKLDLTQFSSIKWVYKDISERN